MTDHCWQHLWLDLIRLTGFFILLEISFLMQSYSAYFADFVFVTHQLTLPFIIFPGIVCFILAQLLVHILYCIVVLSMGYGIAVLLELSCDQIHRLTVSIWLIGILIILIFNQYYYPHSKFAELMSALLWNRRMVCWAERFCWGIILFLGALTTIGVLKQIIRNIAYWKVMFSVIGLGGAIYAWGLAERRVIMDGATPPTPNIILIGVDSLRPDFLSYFGSSVPTPTVDAFLRKAIVFNQSFTPLARTFPSWVSILTGQYPLRTGIRYNLAPYTHLNFAQTLPVILKKKGYFTIYATDETRFSNIGFDFGFDQLITPPMGLNDFLLGTLNDFPLSNLWINTIIGRWLFPYSYANRPVYFTYYPSSFLARVQAALPRVRNKPLFLAIHFCLPHYPYLWAGSSSDQLAPLQRYQASIAQVDLQLNHFFLLLQQYAILKQAIVVLLSDHGEALALPGDRLTQAHLFLAGRAHPQRGIPHFYPSSLYGEQVNQSVGHGTDVLSFAQYRTVLAFRRYPDTRSQHTEIISKVSLLDIKPTLLTGLHLPVVTSDGVPLVSWMTGQSRVRKQWHHPPIFLESDYTPSAIRTIYPKERDVVLEGIHLFDIDPSNAHLLVKKSMGEMIIHSKQYAIIEGDWLLALYPQYKRRYLPILLNLRTAQWTNDLYSAFATHSPAQYMLSSLKNFYGQEIGRLITDVNLK